MGIKDIYVDTAILVYFIEDLGSNGTAAAQLVEKCIEKRITLHTSTVTITECLTGSLQNKNKTAFNAFKKLFTDQSLITIHDLTPQIAESAAIIRAQKKTHTPDALHLATALENECQILVTNDKRFPQAPKIKIANAKEALKLIS